MLQLEKEEKEMTHPIAKYLVLTVIGAGLLASCQQSQPPTVVNNPTQPSSSETTATHVETKETTPQTTNPDGTTNPASTTTEKKTTIEKNKQ